MVNEYFTVFQTYKKTHKTLFQILCKFITIDYSAASVPVFFPHLQSERRLVYPHSNYIITEELWCEANVMVLYNMTGLHWGQDQLSPVFFLIPHGG